MWEQIRANRRKSVMMVVLMGFILVVMGYIAAEAFHPGSGILGVVGALLIFFVQLAVYAFAAEAVLMQGMGARELQREESPRLFNIVEEMKLASGLEHLPRIYLIDEPAPNAFAIGRKPETSAIAVTSGLLHRLSRDELQGVVAHEVGHLKNRDVQFMTLAGILIGSIVILSEIILNMFRFGDGRSESRSRSRGDSDSDNGGVQLALIILAFAVALLGPLMARMLYFAASRGREYLADASAAQFTRYPEGLASALLRISRASIALPIAGKVTAPMFIINPLAADGESDSMFSTHPPTQDRVKVLRSMSGASLGDYNAAFKSLTGKTVIGRQSVHAAPALSIRQASDEGPIATKAESNATVHGLYGYIEVDCSCGAKMRVPQSFEDDKVVCIRCGSKNAIPTASERHASMHATLDANAIPEADPNAPPLQFQRVQTGWESFRCSCGGTVQLSPKFSGSRTFCPKCKRTVEITAMAGTGVGN